MLPQRRGMQVRGTTSHSRSTSPDLHPSVPHPRKTQSMSSKTPIPLSVLSKPRMPSPRNISKAYGLAIPLPSQRRSTYQRRDTPTQYLDPPEPLSKKKGTPYLEIPKSTIVVNQRPKPYTLNGGSSSTIHSTTSRPDRFPSPSKRDARKGKPNDRILAFAVTSVLAILIAIAIPLGVILPQKYIKPLPIKILVPFYLKPESRSWNRLEDAIVAHHDLSFTVIINPNDGPGNMSWPSAKYISAVKRLNIYPNVRMLGYINTLGATLPNPTVRAQIATYALWSNVTDELALHGIFFDQTPWKDDGSGDAREYMRNVSDTAKRSAGWEGEQEGLVVYNPGRVPEIDLMAYKPDVTVVFEGKYADMPKREELGPTLQAAMGGRESYAMLINSVPKELGRGGLRKIVEGVRREVEWLFVTDLTEDVYTGYGSVWEDWLDVAW